MDATTIAVTPGKEDTGKELFSFKGNSCNWCDQKNKGDLQYLYWEDPEFTPTDNLMVKDLTEKDIFEIANSYDMFDESHQNNDKVMKKYFDKLLSPI